MSEAHSPELFPLIWKRRFVAILLVAVALFVLYSLNNILMPFLFAWIAAYLVSPLVEFLSRKLKFSRTQSVVAVMTFSILLVVISLAVAIPIVVDETIGLVGALPHYRDVVLAKAHEWQATGKIHPYAMKVANDVFVQLQASMPALASSIGQWILSGLGSLLGILSFLMNVLLFFFVFFYFLRDFHEINDRIIAAVPAGQRKGMKELLNEIDLNLRAVLRGQFLVAIAMAVLYSIGLAIAGVPYSFMIGTVAGFGNFLPYVGPMLGMIPAFFIVLLNAETLNALHACAGIVIVFGVVQFLEGFVLTPRFAGESVGLGPVAVIFAVSAGGALFGLVGVIAALPLAAISKVLLARAWDKYLHSPFYKGKA